MAKTQSSGKADWYWVVGGGSFGTWLVGQCVFDQALVAVSEKCPDCGCRQGGLITAIADPEVSMPGEKAFVDPRFLEKNDSGHVAVFLLST